MVVFNLKGEEICSKKTFHDVQEGTGRQRITQDSTGEVGLALSSGVGGGVNAMELTVHLPERSAG